MVQNLVLNNADHNFSTISAQLQASLDRAAVVPTPGSASAAVANLRSALEAGALTSSGHGINADHSA